MTTAATYETEYRRRLEGSPSWLRSLREEAWAEFGRLGFPGKKNEDWRFTNIEPFRKTVFLPADGIACGNGLLDRVGARESGEARIVFVNGCFAESSTGDLPEGVEVASFAALVADGDPAISRVVGSVTPPSAGGFVAWNTAFLRDGAVVRVADGVSVEPEIHLVFVSSPTPDGATPQHCQPRVWIELGEGSEATIVESWLGSDDEPYAVNGVTEIRLGEASTLRHVKIQTEGAEALHVHHVRAHQAPRSRFASHSLAVGGRLARTNVETILDGEGSACSFDGLYLSSTNQLIDHHTSIEHRRPGATSREIYKGILDGKGRAVFNGRVVVAEGAAGTDAGQINRNVLLSDDALVHTKPELEIYTDDVKCQHGATIGRLDETAIFYLRSRGIPLEAARRILLRGFAGEILDRLDTPTWNRRSGEAVEAWFAERGAA